MRWLLVGLLGLAACAHDPASLKTEGEIGLDMTTPKRQDEAASCVAAKAAATHPLLSAQRHDSEVYVYWRGALWGIASITPNTQGSRIQLRVQPAMIVATRDSVYEAMRGC